MVKNKEYRQWITLFDSPEDDEFDGELEENDEDLPRIEVTFSITEVQTTPTGQPIVQQQSETGKFIPLPPFLPIFLWLCFNSNNAKIPNCFCGYAI